MKQETIEMYESYVIYLISFKSMKNKTKHQTSAKISMQKKIDDVSLYRPTCYVNNRDKNIISVINEYHWVFFTTS